MSQPPNKLQRLLRLNRFHEEVAEGQLRQAQTRQAESEQAYRAATDQIDALGAWKAKCQTDAGLDIALYGAALAFEQQAMADAQTRKVELRERKRLTERSQGKLVEAISATRVVEKRHRRERAAAAVGQEKRAFDRISNTWLNHREGSDD